MAQRESPEGAIKIPSPLQGERVGVRGHAKLHTQISGSLHMQSTFAISSTLGFAAPSPRPLPLKEGEGEIKKAAIADRLSANALNEENYSS